jgi:hypothetical protein
MRKFRVTPYLISGDQYYELYSKEDRFPRFLRIWKFEAFYKTIEEAHKAIKFLTTPPIYYDKESAK